MERCGSRLSRRTFVAGAAGLGLSGARLALLAGCGRPGAGPPPADAPLETTTLRLVQVGSVCTAPEYVAGELLRAEGFTEVQYLKGVGAKALGSDQADISMNFVAPFLIDVDAGAAIVLLAGIHVGCFELFGTDRVRAINDLRGKRVAVTGLGEPEHVFLASMAAYVGLDPSKDITWVPSPPAESMRLLAEGAIDAYLGFPPVPQELRAKHIGQVVVNSSLDRPWSQYFCCMVVGAREFVRKHPVATKRALRAILKATDICAREPERTARLLVEGGYPTSYDYALQTMQEVPYDKWREYDPEDTVRFYALRLHEAGMIRTTPEKVVAEATDWRILAELKRELKA
jgi:NitT/TauT family transport system substrate-binding protein